MWGSLARFFKNSAQMKMANTKLEAILCDLDDCLIQTSEFLKIAVDAAINEIMIEGIEGFEISREKFRETYYNVRRQHGSNSSSHFNATFEKLGVPKRQANMLIASGIIKYHHTRDILQSYSEVPRTLHSFKDKGYKLYLVTDGDSIKQWQKIKMAGLRQFFDYNNTFITQDFCFETKCTEFYKKILEEINVNPKRCVMIGDKIEKDIIPAKELGIPTIRAINEKSNYDKKYENDADYKVVNFSEVLEIIPKIEQKL